jgi:hypothetical protein
VTTRTSTLFAAVGITLIALGMGSFVAASPPVAQAEVEYLLTAVASSGCEFDRNGEWFDSQKASSHLRVKYDALVALGRPVTAVDFIDKVATKSSLSGRPYLIRCAGGEPAPTNQWLREVLERYRRCASSATPCASWLRHDAQGIDHPIANRPLSRLA